MKTCKAQRASAADPPNPHHPHPVIDADFAHASLPCNLTQSRFFSTFSASPCVNALSLCWTTGVFESLVLKYRT